MDYNNAYNKPYCGISQPVPGPSTGFFPPNATTPTFLKVPNPPYIKQEVGTVGDGAMHGGTVTPPVNYSQNQNYGVELSETPDPDKPLFYRNQLPQHHLQRLPNPPSFHEYPEHSNASNIDSPLEPPAYIILQTPLTSSTPSSMPISISVAPIAPPPSLALSCTSCPKSFETQVKLDKHAETHQTPVSVSVAPLAPTAPPSHAFSCDICSKSFETKVKLDKHVRTHQAPTGSGYHEKLQEEHTIACTLCDKLFCYKASHKEHMFKVHFPRQKKGGGSAGEASTGRTASDGQGRNKFKCTICERRFYYKRALEMHMGVHDATLDVNVLYFSCNFCPETFTEETELEQHEAKHVADGTTDFLQNMQALDPPATDGFRCPLCFKRFDDQRTLREHHKTHLCADPCCAKCAPAQRDEFDLTRSTYDAGEDTRPTACNICHRVLPSFEQFQNHFHYHTTRVPFYCYHCREEFNGKRELYAHSRTHTQREPESYTCEVCAKVFSTKGNYKRHLKSHETVRAFACDRCSKQYDYKSALEAHLKRAHGIEL
uniref:C2H2-type domain-containing protein n=1 Tax=Anopheles dirus TaxID=7168 RepID=A0A182NGP1_9DIPT